MLESPGWHAMVISAHGGGGEMHRVDGGAHQGTMVVGGGDWPVIGVALVD